jgi:hypothetical protein
VRRALERNYARPRLIIDELERIAAKQSELSRLVIDAVAPKLGSYALFHHQGILLRESKMSR